ncbi:MAG: FxLYD domain-containing protein [Candidatus Bathyarchaeota archaeon]|nr:FxLYD domain-containing protein [Candidatus Bathyarchaeota archaeon]
MKKAIVCILLLLAISTLTLSFTPGALSATEDVKILNFTYRFDSAGILVVVGEVQNIGQNVISTVIISGTAIPSYGSEVISGDLVWANNLLPGEKAPFYMQFRSNLTNTGAWTGGLSDVTVRVIQASATTEYQYQGVTITSHEASQPSGGYTIEGEIKNTGSETASNVAVVATFYNSEGKPIAAGYSTKVATMTPQGINSFSLSAINLNQTTAGSNNQISKYALMVQVETPLLSGALPSAQTPVTGPSGSQTPTEPTNNLSPVYIAVFVVAIVVVVVVWLLIKRRRSTDISPRGKYSSSKRVHSKKRRRR